MDHTVSTLRLLLGENLVNVFGLEMVLLLTCLVGDSGLAYMSARFTEYFMLRAAIDSATHGLIGLWSWALVENNSFDVRKLARCLLCAVLAVSVDLDHFYAAKSFNFKSAMSLPNRPPLHLTTIIPVVSITLWVFGWLFNVKYLKTLALIVFVAMFSHHLRDATRRGFWLSPLKNSPRIPYFLYIAVTMLLPFLVRKIYLTQYPSKTLLDSHKEVSVDIP